MSTMNQTQLGAGSFSRHLVARAQKSGARKRSIVIGLSLTSMVDMFSLLVIFLLQTFSTSPEALVISRGVELPKASSGQELHDAPVLALSNEGVFLDQKRVGGTPEILKDPEPLMKRLGDLRSAWIKSHPSEPFKGEISLQAHREIPGTTVSQVMGMLPSQHYSTVQLAVLGGESR
jgi:biopolymer transport protein ExbD